MSIGPINHAIDNPARHHHTMGGMGMGGIQMQNFRAPRSPAVDPDNLFDAPAKWVPGITDHAASGGAESGTNSVGTWFHALDVNTYTSGDLDHEELIWAQHFKAGAQIPNVRDFQKYKMVGLSMYNFNMEYNEAWREEYGKATFEEVDARWGFVGIMATKIRNMNMRGGSVPMTLWNYGLVSIPNFWIGFTHGSVMEMDHLYIMHVEFEYTASKLLDSQYWKSYSSLIESTSEHSFNHKRKNANTLANRRTALSEQSGPKRAKTGNRASNEASPSSQMDDSVPSLHAEALSPYNEESAARDALRQREKQRPRTSGRPRAKVLSIPSVIPSVGSRENDEAEGEEYESKDQEEEEEDSEKKKNDGQRSEQQAEDEDEMQISEAFDGHEDGEGNRWVDDEVQHAQVPPRALLLQGSGLMLCGNSTVKLSSQQQALWDAMCLPGRTRKEGVQTIKLRVPYVSRRGIPPDPVLYGHGSYIHIGYMKASTLGPNNATASQSELCRQVVFPQEAGPAFRQTMQKLNRIQIQMRMRQN